MQTCFFLSEIFNSIRREYSIQSAHANKVAALLAPKHDLGRMLNIKNDSKLVHLTTNMHKDKVKKKRKKLVLIISNDAAANVYDTSNEHISR